MSKYRIKAVFESPKKFDENLVKLEVELKSNILIDKVNMGLSTVSITAYTDDKFFINSLGYTAECYNFDFFFIITDFEELFYTNDVDGEYFSTLFQVDIFNQKTGVIRKEFDSELEIIDDVEGRMNSNYRDLNSALNDYNDFLKSIDKDYYYIVKNYIVLETPEEWTKIFADTEKPNNDNPKITFVCGYYEYNLYINGIHMYSFDSPHDDWSELKDNIDIENYINDCINCILEEYKEKNETSKYNLVKDNKEKVFKAIFDTIKNNLS